MRVLVLCFAPLARDGRVKRQLHALKDVAQVTVAGFGHAGVEGVASVLLPPWDYIPAARRLWQIARAPLHRHEAFYWSQSHIRAAHEALSSTRWDCIIANDIEALPLAVRLKEESGARLVYDAHEYTPDQMGQDWRWRLFRRPYKTWLCRRYMPRADICVTVSEPIAEQYRQTLGVSCGVSMNLPRYHELAPRPTGSVIRLVHHGMGFADRELEKMLDVAKVLDERFRVSFVLLPGDAAYIAKLTSLAASHPRIDFPAPVAYDGIIPMLSGYDMGLHLLPPSNLNHRFALPNKFFEFIQARLALAISPNPAMAAIARQYGLGVVAEGFSPSALAGAINALSTAEIDGFKAQSHAAAGRLHEGAGAQRWREWALGAGG